MPGSGTSHCAVRRRAITRQRAAAAAAAGAGRLRRRSSLLGLFYLAMPARTKPSLLGGLLGAPVGAAAVVYASPFDKPVAGRG